MKHGSMYFGGLECKKHNDFFLRELLDYGNNLTLLTNYRDTTPGNDLVTCQANPHL